MAKCCSNLWIQVDHEVTFLCKLIITILDLLTDPLSEIIGTQRVYHVDKPLPRQLGHISFVRKIVFDLIKPSSIFENGIDGEAAVHGHMQVLCIFRLDNYNYVRECERHLLFLSPRTMSLRK